MTEHTVKAYEHELLELRQMVAEMGRLVEQQIGDSIEALMNRDERLASPRLLPMRMSTRSKVELNKWRSL